MSSSLTLDLSQTRDALHRRPGDMKTGTNANRSRTFSCCAHLKPGHRSYPAPYAAIRTFPKNIQRNLRTGPLDIDAQVAPELPRLGHFARLPRQHDARVRDSVRSATERRDREDDGERARSATGC